MSGTMMSVPLSSAGSTVALSFSSAMMDAYSVPWEPATIASLGPGFAPLMTMTGMLVAASAAAGTWMNPVARWLEWAVAVPTVKSAAWANKMVQRPRLIRKVVFVFIGSLALHHTGSDRSEPSDPEPKTEMD